jgi:hypothetical protein
MITTRVTKPAANCQLVTGIQIMVKKAICFGLASAAFCSVSQADVKYIGTAGGTASSIVDLAVPSVDGVVYTEATFEAAFGGDYTDAASALNGVPTWQMTSDNTYVLEDIVAITNGNLIIDAGTVVRGQPRTKYQHLRWRRVAHHCRFQDHRRR